MRCYTIIMSDIGTYEVADGIEFERTTDPLIGLLKSGGDEVPIELTANIDRNIISNAALFLDKEVLKVAGRRVKDPFKSYVTGKSPIVLKSLEEDNLEERILIHHKIIGTFDYSKQDEDICPMEHWINLCDDLSDYGSFDEKSNTCLMCIVIDANYLDSYKFEKFKFKITLDEDNRPNVEVEEVIPEKNQE